MASVVGVRNGVPGAAVPPASPPDSVVGLLLELVIVVTPHGQEHQRLCVSPQPAGLELEAAIANETK